MSGSKSTGLKAARTIKVRDPDFHKRIGATGGRNGNTGGFAARPDLAKTAGKTGGSRSKRGYKYIKDDGVYAYYQKIATGEEVKYVSSTW